MAVKRVSIPPRQALFHKAGTCAYTHMILDHPLKDMLILHLRSGVDCKICRYLCRNREQGTRAHDALRDELHATEPIRVLGVTT
eukprot:1194846-Prorocentrum_minimum.AAC.2